VLFIDSATKKQLKQKTSKGFATLRGLLFYQYCLKRPGDFQRCIYDFGKVISVVCYRRVATEIPSKEHLAYGTGGRQAFDMLLPLDDLKQEYAGLDFVHAV